MKTRSSLLFLSFLFLLISCNNEKQETSNRIIGSTGDSAMVVSAHPIATKIGLDILRKGGNTIDAAVATQFALAVVYPRAGNIGGGGFAVIRLSDGGTNTLDFREKAPSKSSRDMFLDEDGNVIPDLSTLGHLAAGVPGSVAGMWELHKKMGSLQWPDLIAPAVKVAKEGFHITQHEADALNEKQDNFKAANTHTPWVIKEGKWAKGDLVIQPELAATLGLIQDLGRDGFYTGEVAQSIVQEMKSGNGIISLEDLKNYQPVWRAPIIGSYKSHKIISMPPPSSGGIALIQLLHGAEQLDITAHPHNSKMAVHLMAEVEKRVFADRAKHLGDPDFYDVPAAFITSSNYLTNRYKDIRLNKFTPSSEIYAGVVLAKESFETTHFSIVDHKGNAVAITTTLNLNYGCKVWVKGAGFVLNNEMDDFSAKPGVPNSFGLIGADANAIKPNKRMISSMTPTIIEKDGKLKMILGTPGGSTIITSVFQTAINVIDYGMNIQEAVNAKKIHHQWLPDQIKIEDGALDSLTISSLKAMGHKFEIVNSIGKNDCILIHKDGTIEGGADYTRGDDYAEGF
ncbi:MAG: gamma-glutamyltransferase [Cyclobacteriaceae bacterium]